MSLYVLRHTSDHHLTASLYRDGLLLPEKAWRSPLRFPIKQDFGKIPGFMPECWLCHLLEGASAVDFQAG